MKRVILAVSLTLWVCAEIHAFTISSDQDVDSGGAITGDGAGNAIAPTGSDPIWHYDWSSVSTPGLDLQGQRLVADDTADGSITFNLAGGNLSGTNGTAILAFPGVGTDRHGDDITITNVGTIAMGGIDAHADNGSDWATPYAHAGYVTIGSSASPAGSIQVAYIYTQAGNLTGSSGKGLAGDIKVYGSGDVLVENASGARGDVRSHCYSHRSGHVTIQHQGVFHARDIITFAKSNHSGGTIPTGNVTLDGGDQSGGCEIRTIDTSYGDSNPTYGKDVGDVLIRNYASVSITNIYTYNNTMNDAGHITITNIAGNIRIAGEINATASPTEIGNLVLRSTGGSILLDELDLNKVKTATFSAGSNRIVIDGPLIGFDTGSPANGVLDAPAGQIVYYSRVPTNNLYLGNASYTLKSGGTLRILESFGTVVVFR